MKPVSAPDNLALPSSPNEPAGDLPDARQHLLLSRTQPVVHVAILDDHPVITVGVGAYLEARRGFRVLHRETSSRGLLEKLSRHPCDVALVDFYLPQEPWDGVSYLRRLRRYHPNMGIITFSAGNRQETQYAAFRAGANGYLAKQWGMALLPEMIRGVLSGKHRFLSVRDGRIHAQEPSAPHEALTASEVEILRHISQGLSVTQIAARLVRSKKTISTHKRCAMRKLQLSDDLSLALYLREKFANE
ncbi:response regulator transcription factor [Achromobacter denitrificans]|uniref:response regulator transcription factor n=1 Tax=Achromobacter denitrificans TaxID=32002 RepID=UPI000B491616|nr:response regulator transcription factor [Achromobacter denitrificans]